MSSSKSLFRICFLLVLSVALFPARAVMGQDQVLPGYVACSTSDSYFPLDLNTFVPGPAISLLPEADYPYDATMNPAGTEVWIPGAAGDGVVVIDRATGVITHRIPVCEYAISVAFSNDGSFALVSCRDGEALWRIDTATYEVNGELPIPTTYLGAGNIALNPVSGTFYVVDWYGDDLIEVSADGGGILQTKLDLGSSLWQLVSSPDGEIVYVTDRSTDEVRVVRTSDLTQVGAVHVGEDPWGIDITGDGSKLVVTCEDSHDVHIIDTETLATTVIPLDPTADPRDVDILDEELLAFVTGGTVVNLGNPVYVIDLVNDALLTGILGTCTNTNVIAVQAQMHATGTEVAQDEVPDRRVSLTANPNPFNPRTRVQYRLPRAGLAELAVFDLQGTLVKVLESGWQAAGLHEVSWNGRDRNGRPVGSGVFFLQLNALDEVAHHKLLLLK